MGNNKSSSRSGDNSNNSKSSASAKAFKEAVLAEEYDKALELVDPQVAAANFRFKTHDILIIDDIKGSSLIFLIDHSKARDYWIASPPKEGEIEKWKQIARFARVFLALVKAGADVNVTSNFKRRTPLHVATKLKLIEVVDELIKRGADVNAKDEYRRTPIFYACESDSYEIFELLHRPMANSIASAMGNPGSKSHDNPSSKSNDNPSSKSNDNSSSKSNDNSSSKSIPSAMQAFKEAVLAEDYDKALELVVPQVAAANFSFKSHTAVLIEDIKGSSLIFLVDHSKARDYWVAFAPKEGEIEKWKQIARFARVFLALVKAGADVNVTSNFKRRTPLHVATKLNLIEVIEELIKRDADVNAKDEYRRTPIFYACERGSYEIFELLRVAMGVRFDVNEKDISGISMLQAAAASRNLRIMQCLLDNGANVNSKPNRGLTPLHPSAEVESGNIVSDSTSAVPARKFQSDLWDIRAKQAVAFIKFHQPLVGPDFEGFVQTSLETWGFAGFAQMMKQKFGEDSLPPTWKSQLESNHDIGTPPTWWKFKDVIVEAIPL